MGGEREINSKRRVPQKDGQNQDFYFEGGRGGSRLKIRFLFFNKCFFLSLSFATFPFFSGIVNKRSQLAIDYFSLHHQCLNCELLLGFQDFLSDNISFPMSVFVLVITQLFGCGGLKRPVYLNMILDIFKGWIYLS